MKPSPVFSQLLKTAGLKVTPARIELLNTLSRNEHPLTVSAIADTVPRINQVTVYRALVAMAEAGIVRKVDIQHPYTHYELAATKKHHHHAICSQCGRIEDITVCIPESIQRDALQQLESFSRLTGHSLEFVGMCKNCSKVP